MILSERERLIIYNIKQKQFFSNNLVMQKYIIMKLE